MDWAPPPDPLKPELPYRHGLCLDIQAHAPPQPFGLGYFKEAAPRPAAFWTDLDGMTQSDWCFKHPPVDTPSPPDATIRHLHVLDEVACRDGRGAQIVRCSISDSSDISDSHNGRTYIAKIFDPLYYPYVDSNDDVTWNADRDYSTEAAAYEHLKRLTVDGTLTPKYYGSWTFNMAHSASSNAPRPVRMILMEWIPNCVTMQHLMDQGIPAYISPQDRLDILANAMELYSKLQFYGVRHEDFAPRNVLVVGTGEKSRFSDVILIDFNMSAVLSRPTCRRLPYESKSPINPKYFFWGESPIEFYDWIPQPHRTRQPVFLGWLESRWTHVTEFENPSEPLDDYHDFNWPMEFAPPMEDTDLSPFAHVFSPINPLDVTSYAV